MTVEKSQFALAFKTAFPHTIPVLTGFISTGIAYGILMQTNGYGALWSLAFSTIAYCGSMQFLTISLLVAPFAPIQAFLLSVMVNARHLFYGVSMLNKYKGMGKARFPLIYMLCDETFSITSSIEPPEGVSRKLFYLIITVLDYCYWAIGSVLGGLVGHLIHFSTEGMDFALTALFIVLFLEQMKKKENHIPGMIGIICTIAARLIFGAENLVIPSMFMILIILLLGRKQLCD